ncbi:hypothetical protein SBA4_3180001 [Candidatus Sulfopaludibacter sp. SbA4]|nr:hypothetical protein SBA4_3180001 [Candidatus Sulfopaludibacter sp. SbA4]
MRQAGDFCNEFLTQDTSATVQIYAAPEVTAVTNQNYLTTIHTTDTLVAFGYGFSWVSNQVQLVSQVYGTVTLNNANGITYNSYSQVNASLAGCCAPGNWTVQVSNEYSGSANSAAYPITIVQ